MTAPAFRLIGLKNPAAMEEYSAGNLVDVAHISATGGNCADVYLDESIDFQKPDDRDWIIEILRSSLSKCGETQAEICEHQ
jgi:hypothetical protein